MEKRIRIGTAPLEPRFILWQKIRFPLAISLACFLLLVIIVIFYFYYLSRSIRKELQEAAELVSLDTLDSHQKALEIEESLAQNYPNYEGVRSQFAWHQVLMILRFGTDPNGIDRARQACKAAEDDSSALYYKAAQAGFELVDGQSHKAFDILGNGPESSEELFVLALAQSKKGDIEQALATLEKSRKRSTPFLPALSELSIMLRENGRHSEAKKALSILKAASPGHEGVVLEEALLAIETKNHEKNHFKKIAGQLTKSIEQIKISDMYPRLLGYKKYAEGRIAILLDQKQSAIDGLKKALQIFPKNQTVAYWLAQANWNSGNLNEALNTLKAFPNDITTETSLLQTKLKLLLELHRTVDAQKTLKVLVKKPLQNIEEVSLLEGKLYFFHGEPLKAIKHFKKSLNYEQIESPLLLAEAYIQAGQAHKARMLLNQPHFKGASVHCANGLKAYLNGELQNAYNAFEVASHKNTSCGTILSSRLLVGRGKNKSQKDQLANLLKSTTDLRARIAFGRLQFRVEGVAAAQKELDRVQNLQPQGALILQELADAYEDIGLLEQAVKVTEDGIKNSQEHPWLLARGARYKRKSKHTKHALKYIKKGLSKHPLSPPLLIEQAAVLTNRGEHEEALDALDKALAPGPYLDEAVCLRSQVFIRLGKRTEAQVELLRLAGTSIKNSGQLAEQSMLECLVDIHLKRGQPALERAKIAAFYLNKLDIQTANRSYLNGRVEEADGRHSKAELNYRQAIEYDPALKEAWLRLKALGVLQPEKLNTYKKMWPE